MRNIKRNKMRFRLLIMVCLTFLLGCKSTYETQNFKLENSPEPPDYNLSTSWAVLPTTYSKEFQNYASKAPDTLRADVFYVYPTLNLDEEDLRWNVPVDDIEQNKKVLEKAVLMQASALAISGKVYTPFYRQAHIRSYKMFNKGGKEALELAYQDVKKSFEVYLKKYNKGRPIFILSHSQGSSHTSRLLADFFDGKELQKQLVSAYIPGMRIKPDQFNTIQPMTKPDQIGGFVSWNTFKKGHYPKKDKNWYAGGVTSNPVTWDSSKSTSLEQHKGFLYTNNKIYEKALKIEITDGLVWSSNPKFSMRLFMSLIKNYHSGDINLFWQDIRENSQLRLKTYLESIN